MNSVRAMNKQLIYFPPIQLSKAQLKIWIHKNQEKNQIQIFNIKQYQCPQIVQYTKKFFFKNLNQKDHAAT